MFDAQIVADSISPDGVRLTTMLLTLPRYLLPEFNTHRAFSRNSQSSRARPLAKTLADIEADPFTPSEWGSNQAGMQAGAPLAGRDAMLARAEWEAATADAVRHARRLGELGVHKQTANRVVEPYMWHTVLVTATSWANFFALRVHPDAQPDIARVARMALSEYTASTAFLVPDGSWHLPLLRADELSRVDSSNVAYWVKVSVGRCARVSYLTHAGLRDLAADVELHDQLLASRHMSPFEHVARPMTAAEGGPSAFSGNFAGWHQYRKDIAHEDNYAAVLGVDDLAELLLTMPAAA